MYGSRIAPGRAPCREFLERLAAEHAREAIEHLQQVARAGADCSSRAKESRMARDATHEIGVSVVHLAPDLLIAK